jgi:hypothetical protein
MKITTSSGQWQSAAGPHWDIQLALRVPRVAHAGDIAQSTVEYICDALGVGGADLKASLMVLATELLDNALRYSAPTVDNVSFRIASRPGVLHCETVNRTSPDRAARLQGIVMSLSVREPEDLFRERLEFTATRKIDESGIGLILLSKDHGVILDAEIQADTSSDTSIVTVHAQMAMREVG